MAMRRSSFFAASLSMLMYLSNSRSSEAKVPKFTAAEIRELKLKLGLNNPSKLFDRAFYSSLARNENGRVDACEVARLSATNIGAGALVDVTFTSAIKDEDNLWNGTNGVIIRDAGFYACCAIYIWETATTTTLAKKGHIRADDINGILPTKYICYGDRPAAVNQDAYFLSGIRFLEANRIVKLGLTNLDSVAHNVTVVDCLSVIRVA